MPNSSKDNFNYNKTYGGRAALKIDLDENWTVTPQIMHQNSKTERRLLHGRGPWTIWKRSDSGKNPARTNSRRYALTIEGKIANFDITYAGAYMHRPNSGDQRLHRVCRRL